MDVHDDALRIGPGSLQPTIVASSARNNMQGVVLEVVSDAAASVVEVQAGPLRLVSLMTTESVRELGLQPRVRVVFVRKGRQCRPGTAQALSSEDT